MTEKAVSPFKKPPPNTGFCFHSIARIFIPFSHMFRILGNWDWIIWVEFFEFLMVTYADITSKNWSYCSKVPWHHPLPLKETEYFPFAVCFTSFLSLRCLWDSPVPNLEQSDFGEELLFSFWGRKPLSWKRRKIGLMQQIFEKKKRLLYVLLFPTTFSR